jgi:hypothetical protein
MMQRWLRRPHGALPGGARRSAHQQPRRSGLSRGSRMRRACGLWGKSGDIAALFALRLTERLREGHRYGARAPRNP